MATKALSSCAPALSQRSQILRHLPSCFPLPDMSDRDLFLPRHGRWLLIDDAGVWLPFVVERADSVDILSRDRALFGDVDRVISAYQLGYLITRHVEFKSISGTFDHVVYLSQDIQGQSPGLLDCIVSLVEPGGTFHGLMLSGEKATCCADEDNLKNILGYQPGSFEQEAEKFAPWEILSALSVSPLSVQAWCQQSRNVIAKLENKNCTFFKSLLYLFDRFMERRFPVVHMVSLKAPSL